MNRIVVLCVVAMCANAAAVLVENSDQAGFMNVLLARNPDAFLFNQDCCALPMAQPEFTPASFAALTYTSSAAANTYSFDMANFDDPVTRFSAPAQQNTIQWSNPDQMMMAGTGSGADMFDPPAPVNPGMTFVPNTLPIANYNLAFVNTPTVFVSPYLGPAIDPRVELADILDAPEPSTYVLFASALAAIGLLRKSNRS